MFSRRRFFLVLRLLSLSDVRLCTSYRVEGERREEPLSLPASRGYRRDKADEKKQSGTAGHLRLLAHEGPKEDPSRSLSSESTFSPAVGSYAALAQPWLSGQASYRRQSERKKKKKMKTRPALGQRQSFSPLARGCILGSL